MGMRSTSPPLRYAPRRSLGVILSSSCMVPHFSSRVRSRVRGRPRRLCRRGPFQVWKVPPSRRGLENGSGWGMGRIAICLPVCLQAPWKLPFPLLSGSARSRPQCSPFIGKASFACPGFTERGRRRWQGILADGTDSRRAPNHSDVPRPGIAPGSPCKRAFCTAASVSESRNEAIVTQWR